MLNAIAFPAKVAFMLPSYICLFACFLFICECNNNIPVTYLIRFCMGIKRVFPCIFETNECKHFSLCEYVYAWYVFESKFKKKLGREAPKFEKYEENKTRTRISSGQVITLVQLNYTLKSTVLHPNASNVESQEQVMNSQWWCNWIIFVLWRFLIVPMVA